MQTPSECGYCIGYRLKRPCFKGAPSETQYQTVGNNAGRAKRTINHSTAHRSRAIIVFFAMWLRMFESLPPQWIQTSTSLAIDSSQCSHSFNFGLISTMPILRVRNIQWYRTEWVYPNTHWNDTEFQRAFSASFDRLPLCSYTATTGPLVFSRND